MTVVSGLVNHFRLTWRLFWDQDCRGGRRLIFLVPLLYLLMPFRYDVLADLLPLIGLLDDWLLFVACTYAFVAICPRSTVHRLRTAMLLCSPDSDVRDHTLADKELMESLTDIEQLEMYRHPREPLALAMVLILMIGLSALGGILGTASLLLLVALSWASARLQWARLVQSAVEVTAERFPQVYVCVERCFARLPRVPVTVAVLPAGGSGIYTDGLEPPYRLALGSDLVESLDPEELVAVVARELGHVVLEHTFLSSLMGGMLHGLGILGHLWWAVFSPWRRFAEQTADRVALLVCDELEPVVRAVVKLSSGDLDRDVDVQAVLRDVYAHAEDRSPRKPGLGATRQSFLARLEALVSFDAELLAHKVEEWLAVE
jgi:Zn-dependent protease with chaperone function